MRKPKKITDADADFLARRGAELHRVNSSFFDYPPTWRCPVCGIGKHELLHHRRNGEWNSGIEQHHDGPTSPSSDYVGYLRGSRIAICYLCNKTEAEVRKKIGFSSPMKVESMRQSPEFERRRAKKKVQDTFGTRDPHGKWNTDGTRLK